LDHALTRSVPCAKSPGFPGSCISRSAPAMTIRVSSPRILRRFRRWVRGLPHNLALPVSVSRCGCRSPCTPHLRALPAFDLQVASKLEPFGASSGFQVPGCPVTLSRPSRLWMHHEFPRSCIFRPCRRLVLGSPRFPNPSAPPARQLRVTPQPRTSSCACRCRFQVCPGTCIFRLCRQRIFELPRISRPSAPPVLESSVSLELRFPGCASR